MVTSRSQRAWGHVFEQSSLVVVDAAEWNKLIELKGEELLLDASDRDNPTVVSRARDLCRDDSELDPDLPTPHEPPPLPLALPPPSVPEGAPSAISVPEGDGPDLDPIDRSPDVDETSASDDDTVDDQEDHNNLRNRKVRRQHQSQRHKRWRKARRKQRGTGVKCDQFPD